MTENTLKEFRKWQIQNIAWMVLFTILAAVCFWRFLVNLNSHSWFSMVIWGLVCAQSVYNLIGSFKYFLVTDTRQTILKTQGFEAFKIHFLREMEAKETKKGGEKKLP